MSHAEETVLSKATWYGVARSLTPEAHPQPCAVCGKYQSLTHAHHVVPLQRQWSERRLLIDQRIEWLCPTHHAAVHAFIGNAACKSFSEKRCKVVWEFAVADNEEMMALHRIAMEAVR